MMRVFCKYSWLVLISLFAVSCYRWQQVGTTTEFVEEFQIKSSGTKAKLTSLRDDGVYHVKTGEKYELQSISPVCEHSPKCFCVIAHGYAEEKYAKKTWLKRMIVGTLMIAPSLPYDLIGGLYTGLAELPRGIFLGIKSPGTIPASKFYAPGDGEENKIRLKVGTSSEDVLLQSDGTFDLPTSHLRALLQNPQFSFHKDTGSYPGIYSGCVAHEELLALTQNYVKQVCDRGDVQSLQEEELEFLSASQDAKSLETVAYVYALRKDNEEKRIALQERLAKEAAQKNEYLRQGFTIPQIDVLREIPNEPFLQQKDAPFIQALLASYSAIHDIPSCDRFLQSYEGVSPKLTEKALDKKSSYMAEKVDALSSIDDCESFIQEFQNSYPTAVSQARSKKQRYIQKAADQYKAEYKANLLKSVEENLDPIAKSLLAQIHPLSNYDEVKIRKSHFSHWNRLDWINISIYWSTVTGADMDTTYKITLNDEGKIQDIKRTGCSYELMPCGGAYVIAGYMMDRQMAKEGHKTHFTAMALEKMTFDSFKSAGFSNTESKVVSTIMKNMSKESSLSEFSGDMLMNLSVEELRITDPEAAANAEKLLTIKEFYEQLKK